MKPAKLFRLIRSTYLHDPMKALRAMDDTRAAAEVWRRLVERDKAWVVAQLNDLTRSREAFAQIHHPAAVLLARAQDRLGELLSAGV